MTTSHGQAMEEIANAQAEERPAYLPHVNLSDARLVRANLDYADLTGANLYGANLSGALLTGARLNRARLNRANLPAANLPAADLSGADLYDADLSRANLSRANLSRANLSGATLYHADLTNADLTNADLTGARLWRTRGNDREIKNIAGLGPYHIAYTADRLQIGCENHAINAWWLFTDKEILKMDGQKALTFWRKNKQLIKDHIEANPPHQPAMRERNENHKSKPWLHGYDYI